jgi:hypothetical protein
MHVKQILVYRYFIFQINKVKMCLNEIYICVCLWENRGMKKFILSLSLELVKVGSYHFPCPCDGPQNSYLFFKQPLVDTEFDKPVV